MAKKKSKTVKKASKSSKTKKKRAKSSSTKKTAGKSAPRKKTTKKKAAASKKSSKKKAATKKAARKKAGGSRKRSSTSSKSKADKPANGNARKAASPAGAAERPTWVMNGDNSEWTDAKLRKVKTDLTRKDYNYFLRLLLEKRAEIIGDVAGMEAARRVEDGDISHVPLHMADAGSDNYDQEFTLGLMESERKLINDIDSAIDRVQNKTYGVCIVSGQPIPRERLEIKPWAKYTIDVVRERERRGLT